MERKLIGPLRENHGAQDVGGHHVGRALHTLELQRKKASQRLHCKRLRDSRHTLDQRMAPTKQCQQRLVHQFGLPGDHASDLRSSLLKQLQRRRYVRCGGFAYRPLLVHSSSLPVLS